VGSNPKRMPEDEPIDMVDRLVYQVGCFSLCGLAKDDIISEIGKARLGMLPQMLSRTSNGFLLSKGLLQFLALKEHFHNFCIIISTLFCRYRHDNSFEHPSFTSNPTRFSRENIGHILAYRCHQCGLVSLFFDTTEAPLTNESIKAFYDALLDGGLTLQEPDEIAPPEPLGIDYDSLTDQEKRALYPSLIENLRTIPDWNDLKYPYSLRPRAGKVKLQNQYQILSKIRQGMVWDPFYKRMVLPQNKAHWQHDLEQRHLKHLEEPIDTLEQEEPIPVAVPKKWRLE
ncbi:hypothetical protein CLF_111391, partial [Clonorchis sinensis]